MINLSENEINKITMNTGLLKIKSNKNKFISNASLIKCISQAKFEPFVN